MLRKTNMKLTYVWLQNTNGKAFMYRKLNWEIVNILSFFFFGWRTSSFIPSSSRVSVCWPIFIWVWNKWRQQRRTSHCAQWHTHTTIVLLYVHLFSFFFFTFSFSVFEGVDFVATSYITSSWGAACRMHCNLQLTTWNSSLSSSYNFFFFRFAQSSHLCEHPTVRFQFSQRSKRRMLIMYV